MLIILREMALRARPMDFAIAALLLMLGSGRGARQRACARRGEAGSLAAAAAPLALGQLEVGLDQLLEIDPRLPSQEPPRLGSVALQQVDLGRPQVARVGLDALAPVELEESNTRSRKSCTEWVSPVAMT